MFSFATTVDKALRGVAAGVVAILATWLARNLGLELTTEQQAALVAVMFGVVTGLTNLLKHKFPKMFGWL